MMNQGMRLFDDILEQHAPGSSWLAAAAQRLLPLDPALLIKLLNTLLVIALTVLIYLLARRLAGATAGIWAALVWAWWAPVYGNVMFYFDTLLALCVLLGALALFAHDERPSPRQLLIAGIALGAATLFKQHAWLSVALICLWLRWSERSWQPTLRFAAGALLLPLLQWALLLADGTFGGYLYWNWTYNLSGLMDGVPLDGDLFRKLLLGNLLILPFALLALRAADKRGLLLVALWLAGLTLLYPRFGEIHAMAHLPLAAVMSGIVLSKLAQSLGKWRTWQSWDATGVALAGLALGIGLGWLWTGAVSYLPTPLGAGAVIGYDEFAELAAELNTRKDTDDTLFVLPETDSTPQLHPQTNMPPPGAWVKGWRWYFRADGLLQRLREEWRTEPPTWIVTFPDLIAAGEPGILELVAILEARYRHVAVVTGIYGHGPAEIYRLDAAGE